MINTKNKIITNIETAAGRLEIRQVGGEEVERILKLMQQASDWLLERGIFQWRWTFTEDGNYIMTARCKTDDLYLVLREEEAIATFSLRWQETKLWEERGLDGEACYIHGLTVARELYGMGIGEALMNWAGQHAAARGRRCLRLDTAAANQQACAYYCRLGYQRVGLAPHAQCQISQLFEREIIPDTGENAAK